MSYTFIDAATTTQTAAAAVISSQQYAEYINHGYIPVYQKTVFTAGGTPNAAYTALVAGSGSGTVVSPTPGSGKRVGLLYGAFSGWFPVSGVLGPWVTVSCYTSGATTLGAGEIVTATANFKDDWAIGDFIADEMIVASGIYTVTTSVTTISNITDAIIVGKDTDDFRVSFDGGTPGAPGTPGATGVTMSMIAGKEHRFSCHEVSDLKIVSATGGGSDIAITALDRRNPGSSAAITSPHYRRLEFGPYPSPIWMTADETMNIQGVNFGTAANYNAFVFEGVFVTEPA